jgi:glutamate carboxypeptidase
MERAAAGAPAVAIRDHLRDREDDMVALLEALVSLESPTDVASTQGPVLDALTGSFEALGFRCTRLPARRFGGHLYARPGGVPRRARPRTRQLLIGHCDTVWPIGTLDTMPLARDPQDPDVLRGPGIYDMKAGLVEMIFALQALAALDLTPTVEPLVFINSDEEMGSRESTRYLRALAHVVDRALVLEPSMGPAGLLKTARKGVGKFIITVTGRAAHAGLDPTAGASAILELSHVIQTLFALNDPARGASVNVGMIDGGVRPNVVAPESSAVVDVRVADHADAERIEAAILAIEAQTPGVSVAVSGGIGRPPLEHTPANRRLWRLATDLADEMDLALEEGTAGGGSDGNTTSLYTATLDGLGAVGDGAHAAHEHIRVSQLPERTALLALLLLAPPLGSPDRAAAGATAGPP